MSYSDVVAMVADWDLRMRVVACAAAEQDDGALAFVEDNIWRICSTDGWDTAWAEAVASGLDDPGQHEHVISDSMIRDAVLAAVERAAARAKLAEAAVAKQVADKVRDEDERQFAAFLRVRQYDIEHPRPVQVPMLPVPQPIPAEDE